MTTQIIRVKPNKDAIKDKQKAVKKKTHKKITHTHETDNFCNSWKKSLKKSVTYETRKQLSIMRHFKNKLKIQTQKLERFYYKITQI